MHIYIYIYIYTIHFSNKLSKRFVGATQRDPTPEVRSNTSDEFKLR